MPISKKPRRPAPKRAGEGAEKLKVLFKAELENVTDFDQVNKDSFTWFFKVQCSSCHEVHDNWVGVSREDERDISGSRGTANFVWRCSFCKRESSANFVDDPKTNRYTADEASLHQFGTLCVLECRGCEFIEFDPRGRWKCKGAESGTNFLEVEFEDGTWNDYDEKAGEPVGISEIETKIVRA